MLLLGLVFAALLPACATLPPDAKPDPRDRFERVNRRIYSFNSALDRNVARPAAKAYVAATPAPVRTGISNFFGNLGYSKVMLNDLLQGKVKDFFSDTARLVVNTTIGIGGLFDPASQLGLPEHDEDFGQTLGTWGMPSGPFLMLPLFGPSTVRDTAGLVADRFSEPDTYLVDTWHGRIGLTVGSLLDSRASLLGTDEMLAQSFDPYAFMRNAYLQRRDYQVTDGVASGKEDEFEIFEDEPDSPDGTGAGAAAAAPAPAGEPPPVTPAGEAQKAPAEVR
jgi:phospholipid-binding lipoprotein MlaA